VRRLSRRQLPDETVRAVGLRRGYGRRMRIALGIVMTAAVVAGGLYCARWWRSRREGQLGAGRALLLVVAVLVLVVLGVLGIK